MQWPTLLSNMFIKIFPRYFRVKGRGMPAGNAYPSGHLVPSPIVGLACAPIVETIFLELAMSLLDFSPRKPLGTFSILLNIVKLYWLYSLLLISFLFINKPSVAPCCLHITCIAKVKSGERYPHRVVNFELNRAYMKIRTPNSWRCCTYNTWLFEYFYGFWGFVVWEISGHFGGVHQSRYCASDCAFLFFFCICNVSKYCFLLVWKAIKVKDW